jgi:integrase
MRKTSLSLHKTRIGGKLFWQVTVPKLGGGRERRTFKDRAEAQTFLDVSKVQRENFGNAALSISEALRVQAIECEQELSAFGKTLRDATKFYLAYLRQRETSLPVASAVAELIEMKRAAHKSARYVRDLDLRLGRFNKTHGERSVASITGKELDEWLAGLAVAPGTRNTFRRDIRTLFSFCAKRGYCPSNEAKGTERAEDVDKPPGILTPAQCSALLGACGDDVLPYVAISLFAGLRAAELEKLDWAEVDLDSGHIEVTAVKSKTKRRRLVPISDNLAAWIRPVAALAGLVAPVGLRKRFDAVKARAGLKEWPQNAMRHSFGSYRLAACADAARVSLEMGNSPAMVFAHYRELVKGADAAKYWNIRPASAANVLEMTA